MLTRIAALTFLIFTAMPAMWAQSVTLNVGSTSGLPGASVSVPITITSSGGALPTAVQWSFNLPAGITVTTVDVGPAATAAGKSLSCGASNCLLFGLNATPIANGTIATANLQIAGNAAGTLPISLVNVVASDINSIPASGGSGTITVNAPVVLPALNTLACGSGSIQTPGSLSCTVSLTAAAQSGGFSVGLSSNTASLTVPSSINVAVGQLSATFTATAAQVAANASATVTALAAGVTRTTSISLVAPAALASLVCTPTSLNSGQSANCTASLNKPAVGSVLIALSDDNGTLTTPASVTIANGASSAVFSVTAGSIVSNQTATVTANYSGVARTAQLSLLAPAPAALNALACAPTNFNAAGTATCTVSLLAAASANTTVTLSDNSANVTVPGSVTVLSGQSSAQFAASVTGVPASETATITASLNGATRSANLSLTPVAAPAVLSALTCAPTSLSSNQSANCTVTLDKASVGGSTVVISDDNAALTTPVSVNIANGASSAAFAVTSGSIATNQAATVTVNLNGVVRTAQLSLIAPAPASLNVFTCAPTSFNAAGTATCTVTLASAASVNTLVALTENSASLTVPGSATIAAGQNSAQFAITVAAVTVSESPTITASLNGLAKFVTLTLTAPPSPASISTLSCSPSSLTSNQNATCAVTLDKASSGTSTLTLSDDSAQLSTPGSLTIGSGSSSGSFSVNASPIASSQAATVTATLNGISRTAVVNLVAPTGLSGLTCAPASFTAAGSATCTVTLVAAAATNTVVTLTSGSATVTLPASVTVLSGQNSAQFQASISTPQTDQSVSITASLNGGTQTTNLTLLAPAVLSSLICTPGSLNSEQTATCTVSLNKATGSGLSVSLSSSSPLLNMPGSVSILNGASSGSFAVIAGTIASTQTVSVTASLNSVSKTTSLSLTAPSDPTPPSAPALSNLTCSPSSVVAGGSSLCVITLSSAASVATAVGIASGSDSIALASSVSVQPASDSAQFRVNIPLSATAQQVQITATLAGVTRSSSITVTPAPPVDSAAVISSIACSPSQLGPGATGVCTAYLVENTGTGLFATLASSSPGLTLPPAVQILANTKSQSFDVVASDSIVSAQTVDVSANLNGKTVTTRITLSLGDEQPPLKSFDCSSASITSGGGAVCVVNLRSAAPFAAELSISSNNALIQVPSRLTVAAGATSASFAIQAGNTDSPQDVTLSAFWHGASPITKLIQVKPHSITLNVPSSSFVRAGSALGFDVRAIHSAGAGTEITASGLPSGANLRAGRFTWTPNESQLGEYPVQFRAQDSTGMAGTASSRVVVRAAQPTIQGLFNPAGYTQIESCSPNAIVTFLGTGFSLHDPTEASITPWPTELAGVRIRINGVYAPITFVSDTTIHFQCPVSQPGVSLEIVMEYEAAAPEVSGGAAATAIVTVAPVVVRMTDATPGIYLIKGTQGAVLVAGTGLLAGPPSPEVPSRSVTPGEYIEIYANGLGGTTEPLAPGKAAPLDHLIRVAGRVTVVFADGQRVPAEFAGLTPGSVGLFQVNAIVPATAPAGSAVPIYLELAREDGTVLRSNTVTIAVGR